MDHTALGHLDLTPGPDLAPIDAVQVSMIMAVSSRCAGPLELVASENGGADPAKQRGVASARSPQVSISCNAWLNFSATSRSLPIGKCWVSRNGKQKRFISKWQLF